MPKTSAKYLYDTPLYPQRRIMRNILSQSMKKPQQPYMMNQKRKGEGGGTPRCAAAPNNVEKPTSPQGKMRHQRPTYC